MEQQGLVEERRQFWRDFIASPEHAGRFLSRVGDAVGPALSEPIHMDELETFLASLKGGPDDMAYLALVLELLSGGHREFVADELPILLDQLSSETGRRDEIVGPTIRGAVRWMETRVARRTGRLPYGRYLSVVAHRSYDIPENRTIRRYLDALDSTCAKIVRLARPGRPPTTIDNLSSMVRALQEHDAMRDLRTTEITDQVDLDITEASDRREYTAVARLLRSVDRLLDEEEDRRSHNMLMLLAVGWLEPLSDDDLFELYMLVLVLDVLRDELGGGEPVERGLVRRGREHVARYEIGEDDVLVFFDTSLARILRANGRYKGVVTRHEGVSGAERRPDIVMVRRTKAGDTGSAMIVEAKRSDDGRYISDSIYKVFGYLHDFGDVAELQAVLAVPDSVSLIGRVRGDELTIVSGEDRAGLVRALRPFVKDAAAKRVAVA